MGTGLVPHVGNVITKSPQYGNRVGAVPERRTHLLHRQRSLAFRSVPGAIAPPACLLASYFSSTNPRTRVHVRGFSLKKFLQKKQS
jgi:hypothetical protein